MDHPRLFHLAAPSSSPRAGAGASWSPHGFATEGFVHLSRAVQLAGTLAAHFGGVPALELFEVELPDGDPALRWEISRGGAPFPHLYRPILASEWRRWWQLERTEDGWSLPRLGETPASDDPPGTPLTAS